VWVYKLSHTAFILCCPHLSRLPSFKELLVDVW
jgi:hypothetical protein